MRIGSADRSLTAGSHLPSNAWTHLAATYDGTRQRLYNRALSPREVAAVAEQPVTQSAQPAQPRPAGECLCHALQPVGWHDHPERGGEGGLQRSSRLPSGSMW